MATSCLLKDSFLGLELILRLTVTQPAHKFVVYEFRFTGVDHEPSDEILAIKSAFYEHTC